MAHTERALLFMRLFHQDPAEGRATHGRRRHEAKVKRGDQGLKKGDTSVRELVNKRHTHVHDPLLPIQEAHARARSALENTNLTVFQSD
jgi:hypothetical protein